LLDSDVRDTTLLRYDDTYQLAARDITKKGLEQWQKQWDTTEKGAECRSFFPRVEQRLKQKIPLTFEFTALVTGHGKTESYLHRFKLIDYPGCPCNEGQQTPDHIISDCSTVEAQRSYLMEQVALSGGTWPPTEGGLTSKYLKCSQDLLSSLISKT
jgi:hypothetical protein